MHDDGGPRFVEDFLQGWWGEDVGAHVADCGGEGGGSWWGRVDVDGCYGVAVCGEEVGDYGGAEEAAAACY